MAQEKEVERKIYFYRADIGKGPDGRPLPFDPSTVLHRIEAIRNHNIDAWYVTENSGVETCCWVDSASPAQRLRLASVRRSDLPQVEQDGKLKKLPIPLTSGLAENIHVMFFPHNIVGCEFNFHGPRIPRLANYFTATAHDLVSHIEFQPLLRRNALQQLRKLQDIHSFRLKIHASFIDEIYKVDTSLGAAFRAALNVGNPEEIEILLKPKRFSREPLSSSIMNTIKGLAQRTDLHEGTRKFEVKARISGAAEVGIIDLLADQLIVKKKIMRVGERDRALKSESAYAAIKEAYQESSEQLQHAASIS